MKLVVLLATFIVLLGLVSATNYCVGSTANFTCGDTITQNCTLNGSISANGTCFTIGANDITLEGGGYTIIGNTSVVGDGINNTGFNNTIIKNCTILNFTYYYCDGSCYYSCGIRLKEDTNSTIQDSTIISNLRGIVIYNSDKSYIHNNNISVNNRRGILGNYKIYNSTISNNTFTSNNYVGIEFYRYCAYNLVKNNTFTSNGGDGGLHLDGGIDENHYNTIIDNTFNQSKGLSIGGGNNNNEIYNNNFYNGSTFYINNAGSGNTFNNSDTGNYYDDILTYEIYDTTSSGTGDSGSDYPYNSSQSKWTGNGADYHPLNAGINSCGTLGVVGQTYTLIGNITTTGDCFTIGADDITLDCDGYTLSSDTFGSGVRSNRDNLTIKNCIIKNFSDGIELSVGSDNHTFSNNTIYDNGANGIDLGISSDGNLIYDNTIYDNNGKGIYTEDGEDNTGYNNVFNNSENLYVAGDNNHFYNNSFYNGSTYHISNSGSGNTFNTSDTGNYYDDILTYNITDSTFNGKGDTGSDYPYNSSQSKWTGNGADYHPLNAGINSCGTLGVVGQTYTLIGNITTTGDCFTIGADDITLDCDGYTLDGDVMGGDIGVYTTKDEVTVKNCRIKDFYTGIKLYDNYNNTLINNSGFGQYYSFYLDTSSNNNITNNSLYSSSSGIVLDSGHNNTLINNNMYLNEYDLQMQTDSDNNTIYDNTFNSSKSITLDSGADNNSIYNNSFYNGSTYHINNSGTGNTFNNSDTGNYYDDITSLFIFDTTGSGTGDTGVDYPYNSSQSKWTGNGADYHPLNAREDVSGPNCSLISRTISDLVANSTGEYTVIINCSDIAGVNVSRAFITKTLEGFETIGLPNRWSIRPPSNDKADECSCVLGGDMGHILLSDGRNHDKWYESLGLFDDNFSYSVQGSDSSYVTITDHTTWALINYSWHVEPTVFRNSVFLNRGLMEKENKTGQEYEVYKNNPLLVKFWDLLSIRNVSNYSITSLRNINYSGSPNKDLVIYYCNASYNLTGGSSPITDVTNCVAINSLTTTELDDIDYVSRNSSYSKSSYTMTNKYLGGIKATGYYYVYYTSKVPSPTGKYLIRYANGSTTSNVSFNETNVAWGSTDNGVTLIQQNFSPDLWFTGIKEGDDFQFGVYMEDRLGHNTTNFTLFSDEIGDVNWSITNPNILAYQEGIVPVDNHTNADYDLNNTYSGNMTIHVLIGVDPDGQGTVNHSLYLRNTDGSANYTINSSFYSSDDSYVHVYFDTTLVNDGTYKMNVTAVADDDATDVQSKLTIETFTINNSVTITSVSPKSAEDPGFCIDTNVGDFTFNVTLGDGDWEHLNLSETYVNLTNSGITTQTTSCSNISNGTAWVLVNCSGAVLGYGNTSGYYTITVNAVTNAGISTINDTTNMTYNEALNLNVTETITWSLIEPNTLNNLNSNVPTYVIENCGNVNIDVKIKGNNISSSSGDYLSATKFTASNSSTSGIGTELNLTESSQEYLPATNMGTANSSRMTLDTWWFVDVPLGQSQGTYNIGVFNLIVTKH